MNMSSMKHIEKALRLTFFARRDGDATGAFVKLRRMMAEADVDTGKKTRKNTEKNTRKNTEKNTSECTGDDSGGRKFNARRLVRGNKGSYMVEAALALPVFILCVVALVLIVKIVAVCENITFVVSSEVHKIDTAAYTQIIPPQVSRLALTEQVYAKNTSLTDFKVKNFDYLFSKAGIDDLIAVDCQAKFKVTNPIGIKGKIDFDSKLMSRGFTGALQDGEGLDRDKFTENEKSRIVVVFPRYGIRYHVSSCWYVNKEYDGKEYKIEMELEDAKAKGYTTCKVCLGGE